MFESHYQLQKNAFRVFAKSIFYSADGRKAGSSPVKTVDEKIFVQFLSIDFTHLLGLCYNEKNLECLGRMIEEKADWKTGYQEALGYLGGII